MERRLHHWHCGQLGLWQVITVPCNRVATEPAMGCDNVHGKASRRILAMQWLKNAIGFLLQDTHRGSFAKGFSQRVRL